MFIMNVDLCGKLREAAAIVGLATEDWLDDGDVWEARWEASGVAEEELCAVECGAGVVAWGRRLSGLWQIIAIAPDEGYRTGTFLQFGSLTPHKHKGDPVYSLPETWVTKWRARDLLRPLSDVLLPVGTRCACTAADQTTTLGIVASVDAAGKPDTVQIGGPDGRIVPANTFGKRWYRLNERDDAFDAIWSTGQTTWPYYVQMLSVMARKHKALNKLAGKPAPVPGNVLKAIKHGSPIPVPKHAQGAYPPIVAPPGKPVAVAQAPTPEMPVEDPNGYAPPPRVLEKMRNSSDAETRASPIWACWNAELTQARQEEQCALEMLRGERDPKETSIEDFERMQAEVKIELADTREQIEKLLASEPRKTIATLSADYLING